MKSFNKKLTIGLSILLCISITISITLSTQIIRQHSHSKEIFISRATSFIDSTIYLLERQNLAEASQRLVALDTLFDIAASQSNTLSYSLPPAFKWLSNDICNYDDKEIDAFISDLQVILKALRHPNTVHYNETLSYDELNQIFKPYFDQWGFN